MRISLNSDKYKTKENTITQNKQKKNVNISRIFPIKKISSNESFIKFLNNIIIA